MVENVCFNWVVHQDIERACVSISAGSAICTNLYFAHVLRPFRYPLVLVDSVTLDGRNAFKE